MVCPVRFAPAVPVPAAMVMVTGTAVLVTISPRELSTLTRTGGLMDVLTAALDGWTEMARRVAGSGAGTKPNAGSPSSQPTANTSAERIAKRRIVLSGKGPGPERSAGPTSLLTVHPVAGKRPSGPFQQEGDEPGRRALS